MPTRLIATALTGGLCLAAAMTFTSAPGTAQERLPWEPPAADPYRPPATADRYGDVYNPAPQSPPLIRQPSRDPRTAAPRRYGDAARPYERNSPGSRAPDYGTAPPPYADPPQPYAAPRQYGDAARPYGRYSPGSRAPDYGSAPPPYADPPPPGNYPQAPGYYEPGYTGRSGVYEERRFEATRPGGTYSVSEITGAGHQFFGSISKGLASVIEYAFKKSGRPNGYILGEGAGGAFIAGLRYGEGKLYTKSAGTHRIYWQGPSIGYDVGAEGSKTMVLVYNLRYPSEIFDRFGGLDGSAFLVGGVGITFLKNKHVILAPIRAGVGLRLGANIGYLKYTRRPTWNPF